MPFTSKILGRSQETQSFSAKEVDYRLTTRLEAFRAKGGDRALKSSIWIEARFSLKQEGDEKGRNVGHVYVYKVDKTVHNAAGAPWLSEILTDDDAELAEPRTSLRELYDDAGNIRHPQHWWADDLRGSRILLIDTLLLHPDWRGTGLSKVAMRAFHRLLPQISNDLGYEGTIVLSPAASEDHRESSTKTDAEIERALISLYGQVGYEAKKGI